MGPERAVASDMGRHLPDGVRARCDRDGPGLGVGWGVALGKALWQASQCSSWSSSYFSQKRLVKGKQVRCSIQGQLMG